MTYKKAKVFTHFESLQIPSGYYHSSEFVDRERKRKKRETTDGGEPRTSKSSTMLTGKSI